MKLLTKFTLIFVLIFGTGVVLSAYLSFQFLETNARDQVLQQARLMIESASSMRHYTEAEVAPLIENSNLRRAGFYPQTIPFYAATQAFNSLRAGGYPDYVYKEAALNPTNLRDRAVDWETDVINSLRNFPDRKEVIGVRDTPNGKSLFLAHPIKTDASCSTCHSSAVTAPSAMVRLYGPTNGFGWKANEIVGAQIISVPMELTVSIAQRAFTNLVIYMGGVALLTIIALDLALVFTVVRPVAKLSRMADEISQGNMDIPELPVRGTDEIAQLAGSFNRMHVSLAKAMGMLEE